MDGEGFYLVFLERCRVGFEQGRGAALDGADFPDSLQQLLAMEASCLVGLFFLSLFPYSFCATPQNGPRWEGIRLWAVGGEDGVGRLTKKPA